MNLDAKTSCEVTGVYLCVNEDDEQRSRQSINSFYEVYTDGFSLLEVILTLCILSFSLLGIVGMYLYAEHKVLEVYNHTLGVLQLFTKKETIIES